MLKEVKLYEWIYKYNKQYLENLRKKIEKFWLRTYNFYN